MTNIAPARLTEAAPGRPQAVAPGGVRIAYRVLSAPVPRDKISLTDIVPGTAILSAGGSPSKASSPPIG
ncbi:hypothetical protein SBD_8009 [Streptomyces bottropensis ATCC 25435]|uniref:Uncharacterized protein n=1 Tax=Streptomyces bottropensis ATCC 25435 TaxID=1054862 RepID=M3FCA5_9ACTN|nr:hypothetical protein SBD_8009 [Streptomyces bottropensis ATCC 25435]